MKKIYSFLLLSAIFSEAIAHTTTILHKIGNDGKISVSVLRDGKPSSNVLPSVPYNNNDTLIFKLSSSWKKKFTYTIQTNKPISYNQTKIIVSSAKDTNLKKICNQGNTLTIRFSIDPNNSTDFKYTLALPVSPGTSNGNNNPATNEGATVVDHSPAPKTTRKTPAHYTGIAYYDALTLVNPSSTTKTQWISIVCNYIGENPQNFDTILKHIAVTDTLLSSVLRKIYNTDGFIPDSAGLHGLETTLASGLSAAGNLDITNIADGFAKFLVKRTKEELSAAFFQKFKDYITKYPEAKTLFPNTYTTLSAIGDQIYNYKAYMNSLKESFEEDLDGLLPNLEKVLNDDRYSGFFTYNPTLKTICLSSLYLGKGLLDKEQPGQIISDYDTSLIASSYPDIKGAVASFQLLSNSVKCKGTGNYWISADSLKILLNNPQALLIYTCIIAESGRNIKFSSGKSLKKYMLETASPAKQIQTFISGFVKQTDVVSGDIKNLTGKDKDKLTFADYYTYYNSALDLVEYTSNLYKLPGLDFLKPGKSFSEAMDVARAGGNLALDISQKNYSAAIMNVYTIYQYATNGGVANVADVSRIPAGSDDFKSSVLKYGSLIAAIAQAQNSDDVEAAIEAIALPSGSSSIKRQSAFNVAINAYTGLFAGGEQILKADYTSQFCYGVTAPIGISISRGHSFLFFSTGAHPWSTSFFLSVVDIGALAAFRFTNDSVSQVPNIQLKDIISPGGFISLGIPNCPLSINLGAQIGPNLREVTSTSNDYSNNLYWRFSASLCVDLPLLNLYNKSTISRPNYHN